jgi:hypothetical protein
MQANVQLHNCSLVRIHRYPVVNAGFNLRPGKYVAYNGYGAWYSLFNITRWEFHRTFGVALAAINCSYWVPVNHLAPRPRLEKPSTAKSARQAEH